MNWMEQAVCKSVDPGLFVPDGAATEVRDKSRQAQSVCRRCPVIAECGQYALDLARQSPVYGVWGGMTAKEINHKARRLNVA